MADDVSTTEEHQAVPVEEQVEAKPEAVATDDDSATDVSAVDAPDMESEAESSPDPEHLDDLLKRYPNLREQMDARDRERENAGAQRREAQLRREAGNKDATRRNVAALFEAWGIEDEPDEKNRMRVDYLYDLASANSMMDLAIRYADYLKEHYSIPTDFRERAVASRESNDFDGYVSTLIEGAVVARMRNIDGADVPRDSNIYRWMLKERDRMVAEELKAKEIESKPKPKTAPPVRGSAPTPKTITGSQYAAGNVTDRKRWNDEGYMVVLG